MVAPFREANFAAHKTLFNVNFHAAVLLTKFALPHLEKTKGNIVYISSVGCKEDFDTETIKDSMHSSVARSATVPTNSSYNASKAALTQFARTLALEEAPRGIRVNVINPGATATPLLQASAVNR